MSYYDNGSCKHDQAAIAAVGRKFDYSGQGVGQRDLGWIWDDRAQALDAARKLKRKGLDAWISQSRP